MIKRIFVILFLCSAFRGLSTIGYAEPVSSVELISNARGYDGSEVTYKGELVGEIMRRPPYAWLNVSDSSGAIGVWAGMDLVKEIKYAGSYNVRGDKLVIVGIFHRACPEHGGDLDIHASKLSIIEAGQRTPETLDDTKKTTAVLLLGALVLVWILNRLPRK